MSGIVLKTGNTAVNNTDKILILVGRLTLTHKLFNKIMPDSD